METNMEKLYWIDGTPVDILRRIAKKLKAESTSLNLSAALDKVAKSRDAESWPDLIENCWSPEEPTMDDCGFIHRRVGRDKLTIDFEKLPILIDQYDGEPFLLFADYSLGVSSEPGCVEYFVTLTDRPNPFMELPNYLITPSVGEEIWEGIELHSKEGQNGPLISALHRAGVLNIGWIESAKDGEFEALLTLKLRQQGDVLGERYLLNCRKTDSREGEPPLERCWIFKMTGERFLLSNGEENLDDMVFRIFPADEWDEIERELRRRFPDGPENTYESEKWLCTTYLGDSDKQGYTAVTP